MLTSRRAAALVLSRNSLLAGAQVHREIEQAVLVDEIVLHQGLGQFAAAVHLKLIPRQFLQLGDLGRDVPAQQCGVVPVRGRQRGGGDVLRQRIELARDEVSGIAGARGQWPLKIS